MIDLLFNSNFWYTLIVIAAAVLIFIACLKYPAGKYFIGTVILIVAVGATIYCGTQLYYYYDAEGATFGTIDIDEPNKVDVDDFRFNFQNFELKQVSGDEYSAEAHLSEILELDENKTYGIFINETPCDLTQYSSNYLTASYSYTFRDDDLSILMEDTLQINFAFNTTSTDIKITTYNGAEAVKYWNNYFNKNNIVITIQELDYTGGTDITYGDGEVSNYNVLTYFVDGEEYTKQAYKTGSKIVFPEKPEKDNLYFAGWKIGESFVDTSYIVNSNQTLIAVFESREQYTITFKNGNSTITQKYFEGEKVVFPNYENIEGWVDGMYTTYPTYINTNDVTANDNKTYYALAWRDLEIENGEKSFGFVQGPAGTGFYLSFQKLNLSNYRLKFDIELTAATYDSASQIKLSNDGVAKFNNVELVIGDRIVIYQKGESMTGEPTGEFDFSNINDFNRATNTSHLVYFDIEDGALHCRNLSFVSTADSDLRYFDSVKISNVKALY